MQKISVIAALAMAGAVFALSASASELPEATTEQPGTVAATPSVLQAVTSLNLSNINRGIARLNSALGAPPAGGLAAGAQQVEGKSAGGGEGRLGVWLNGSWTDIENTLSSTAYEGDIWSVFGGADFMVTDRLFLGAAVGYDSTSINTFFNQGSIEADGYTIAPYALYLINNWLSLDASVGYSRVDYDLRRIDPTGTAVGVVSGTQRASRIFGAANLTGFYRVNRWNMVGSLGYLHTRERQRDFFEFDTVGTAFGPAGRRNVDLGQVNVGVTVGYTIGQIEPFVTARYEYDVTREVVTVAAGQAQPANDRSGFVFGGGLRFGLTDRVSGSIEASTLEGREDLNRTTVSGTIRIQF